DTQPRLRRRLGRVPDGDRRGRAGPGWPAADRDGLAAHPRVGGRGRRTGRLSRRLRVHVEYSIAGLAVAPVDGYGVGTSLVTGSGAPTAALVYKMVARSDERMADG